MMLSGHCLFKKSKQFLRRLLCATATTMCDVLLKKSPLRRSSVQQQRVWYRGGQLRKSERPNYCDTDPLLALQLAESSGVLSHRPRSLNPSQQHSAARIISSAPAARNSPYGNNNSGKSAAERACRRSLPLPNSYNVLLARIHEPYNVFSQTFIKQFTKKSLPCTETSLIKQMSKEINHINRTVLGATYPTNKMISETSEVSIEPEEDFKPIVPQSQWIYETPDKQRMRPMAELNFNDHGAHLEPAVLQMSKRMKSIYQLNQRVQGFLNVNSFIGQEVPINLSILEPICTVSHGDVLVQSPVVDNQFLLKMCEETITFDNGSDKTEVAKKRKREDDKENTLNWYEKEMKLLATCRPGKPQDKTCRRTLLQRKSLSFQGDTPPSHTSRFRYRYRSMEGDESGLSPLENATDVANLIDSEFYSSDCTLANNASASPQLSMILNERINLNSNYDIPAPKFYPRKNFD